MNISLNPSFLCNLRCNFCYLTHNQLGDIKTLQLERLEEMFDQLTENGHKIEHIDLYGGEIGLLDDCYLVAMFSLINNYYKGKVNIITNLTNIHSVFLRKDVDLSVSFDFECRSAHKVTLQNIILTPKPVHILMLASKCLIKKDVQAMINMLNIMTNVVSVEVKPYSTNQSNQQPVDFIDFENFVLKFITASPPLNAVLVNELNLQRVIDKQYSSWSDNHVYITPSGKWGVLEFDHNDNEFFMELDTLQQYFKWTETEKQRVEANQYCSQCDYLGHCLSEHLRDVKSLDRSCNGFQRLIQWYQNEKLETATVGLS